MEALPEMNLELGVIGNGSVAGLIDERGRYVWLCLPRFDGPPVFDALLGGEGVFAVDLDGLATTRQSYIRNTAILRTELEAEDGATLEIIDFAPRFHTGNGSIFRPVSFVRLVQPVRGRPRVRIRMRPRAAWGAQAMQAVREGDHIRFRDETAGFRVTTDAPLSQVMDESEFVLERPITFICGLGPPVAGEAATLGRNWADRTRDQWLQWSRRLAVPFQWQDAVIRAAITLKLCVYEETGGIVAALTSSIPEHRASERNWDYRYCWLRDAYFTVTALNRLSAMSTLEHYLGFLRNIVAQTNGGHIQPVYGVGMETDLSERIIDHLPGYGGARPVRCGNQAAEHIQHDVYGHVILGAAQAFFDQRLLAPPGVEEFTKLERVGERAFAVYDQPDAGIWEYRTRADVHTSSALMGWAACDRLAKIATRLNFPERASFWADRAAVIHAAICGNGWNAQRNAFTGAFGGDALDASVLLMAELGFLPPSDPRFIATVNAIDRELREGHHVFRYRVPDDFGPPQVAFTACTFWHIDALAQTGRRDEALEMFEHIMSQRTRLGLLSEDISTQSGELWGNFPQTYSMVGIINAAARLSRPWAEAV